MEAIENNFTDMDVVLLTVLTLRDFLSGLQLIILWNEDGQEAFMHEEQLERAWYCSSAVLLEGK